MAGRVEEEDLDLDLANLQLDEAYCEPPETESNNHHSHHNNSPLTNNLFMNASQIKSSETLFIEQKIEYNEMKELFDDDHGVFEDVVIDETTVDYLDSDFSIEETVSTAGTETTVTDDMAASTDAWIYEAINLETYLETIFPNYYFSTNVIYESLCISNCNYDKAAEMIAAAFEQVNACRPCRHMLTGKCYRADCSFDHEVSHIPCRYWLSSLGCSLVNEGKYCPFLHQLPSQYDHSYLYEKYGIQNNNSSNNNNNGMTMNGVGLNNNKLEANVKEMDFPELISTSSKNKASNKDKDTHNNNANNNNNSSNNNNKKAPAVKKLSSVQVYDTMFGNNSYKFKMMESIANEQQQQQQQSSSSSQDNNSTTTTSTATTTTSSISLQSTQWIQTGKTVALQYASYRREARLYAIMRNKLLENATKAYLRGDKGTAKKLSLSGQQVNVFMKALHKQAAQVIFAQRNKTESLLRGQIDLHGLHTSEAIELLHEIIPIYCVNRLRQLNLYDPTFVSNSVNQSLCRSIKSKKLANLIIITGSGHHSGGGSGGNATTTTIGTGTTTATTAAVAVAATGVGMPSIVNGNVRNKNKPDSMPSSLSSSLSGSSSLSTATTTTAGGGGGSIVSGKGIVVSKLFLSVQTVLDEYGILYQIIKDNNGYESGFRINTT